MPSIACERYEVAKTPLLSETQTKYEINRKVPKGTIPSPKLLVVRVTLRGGRHECAEIDRKL